MEFFRDVNVDWMGKAKYFVALSVILLVLGWASILKNGGIKYGIDFRGGTLVYVRFAGPAPVDQIRKGLAAAGLADSSIQTISDMSLSAWSRKARATNRSTPVSRRFSMRFTRPLALPLRASLILILSRRNR
jgi:preprotein translocase subunit SecF